MQFQMPDLSGTTGERLAFDVESNGLMRAKGSTPPMDRIHCAAITDLDNREDYYYGPPVPLDFDWMGMEVSEADKLRLASPAGTMQQGLERLSNAELAIAHNGITFDYLAIEKVYPEFIRPAKAWDTYVMAKLVWPYDALVGPDMARVKQGKLPPFLMKSHSLKAWGYRLGEHKAEYTGDLRIEDPVERKAKMWSEWNPFMAAYMMQDNRPMLKLWDMMVDRLGWNPAKPQPITWPEWVIQYEHEAAAIIAQQELDGVRFDIDKARKLEAHLLNERARLRAALEETFGSWWHPTSKEPVVPAIARNVQRKDLPDVTVRKFSEKTGKELKPYVGPPLERYSPDAPYTPIERVTFSASSRDHLGMRLQDVYGWKPKKFGSSGKPTVDESVLEEIPEAVLPADVRKMIMDFFVINKTLGMVAQGSKAWLHMVEEDGRIHGRVDPCGTITGRGAHSSPNLGQCPAIRKMKVTNPDGTKTEVILYMLDGRFGYECRELFTADEGWEQTGIDASSLELIDLGHYLHPLDGGKFSERVCDPTRDAHQEHADIADVTRSDAKTTIYLIVYGGSAYKLSLDPAIVVTPEEMTDLLRYRGLPMLLKSLERRFDEEFVAKMDPMQKARLAKARLIIVKLEGGIEGLKELKDGVTKAAEKGYIKGMDGRRMTVRKAHAALNTLLQSAGAQTCKLWMVLLHRKLRAAGLRPGVDYKQLLWVHDELQFTHRPGLGPQIKALAEEAMVEAGLILGLRGRYRSDAKHGKNWAECH